MLKFRWLRMAIIAGLCAGGLGLGHGAAYADSEDEALAKSLSNPLASLISLPIQFNYDSGYGTANGDKLFVNVQPVIPFALSDDLNLITRTIIPIVIDQNNIAGLSGSQSGFGDIVQSLWLSPSQPTSFGLIWGAGVALLWPSGNADPLLGAGKFGVGPTAVGLIQTGPWTIGGLWNHIWSVAGDSTRAEVNNTFIQPFLVYTTPSAWSFTLNTETNYNWTADTWSVPINAMVSKLVVIGGQRVSFQVGIRGWAVTTPTGPDGVGARFAVTFLFPK